jgi:hypothetical protein
MEQERARTIRIYHFPMIFRCIRYAIISFIIAIAITLLVYMNIHNNMITIGFALLLFLFAVIEYRCILRKKDIEIKNLIDKLCSEWVRLDTEEIKVVRADYTIKPVRGYEIKILLGEKEKTYFLRQVKRKIFSSYRDLIISNEIIVLK